ncbi:putative dehydrogenase [Mycobacterium kansasii 662]|uniref:Putative dehydrogenase n=1 Tax=Mycobacterium kansasii 662 TaxID=1299326 RepID=X7XW38_MYCKA|nr:putative dehydrogenase [Mycobacterium kansasii 662]
MDCAYRSVSAARWSGGYQTQLTDRPIRRLAIVVRGATLGWLRCHQRRLFLPWFTTGFRSRRATRLGHGRDVLEHFRPSRQI